MLRIVRISIAIATLCAIAPHFASAEQSPAPKIIVSGASGQLGGMAVEELLASGVEPSNLILVSRTPETLERYARMGASTRFGDFTRPESLPAAYAGGDKMLLISLNTRGNPNPRVATERAALHQIAIDAAVAAGVEHIVYTSYVDAERNTSPIAVDHRLTEAMLRASGVAWTALRDQWYADRIVGEGAEMVAAGRVLVDPNEVGAAYVTREDCAAAAAAVLTTPGHENRIYEITGPARILRRDIARIASELTGVPIEVIEATPDQLSQVPEPPPSSETLSTHFEDLTGRPGTTARQILEANRATLLAARPG
jgi:NAD(P)H dehydrogenase (quinone)